MSAINKCASHRGEKNNNKGNDRKTHTRTRAYRAMLHKMRPEPVWFTVMWVSDVFLPEPTREHYVHEFWFIWTGQWWLDAADNWVCDVRLCTPEDGKMAYCSVARTSRLTYDVSCCCHSRRWQRRRRIFISRWIIEYGSNQCDATVFGASHRSLFCCGFFFESIVEPTHNSEHVTWHRSHEMAIVLARIQSPSLQRC